MKHSTPTTLLSVLGRSTNILNRLLLMLAVASLAVLSPALSAQTKEGTGGLRGRIFDTATQRYVVDAIVSLPGTSVSIVTDETGNYYLPNLAAGDVKVRVTYADRAPIEVTIAVPAGKEFQQDLYMGAQDAKKSDVIMMDEFKVQSNRFQSAEALALAAERASPNLKEVISIESLGINPSKSVGEMLRMLPGMEASFATMSGVNSLNPSSVATIASGGFDAEETEIWIDGMPATGGSLPGVFSRAVGLDLISMNNIARVEIIKTPPLESMNNKLGYVINLVTRSSLEVAKPTYTTSIGMTFNTVDGYNPFEKRPGPGKGSSYHNYPSVSLEATVPVSKKFGFNVGLSWSRNFSPNYSAKTRFNTTNANNTGRYYTATYTTTYYNSWDPVNNTTIPGTTARSSSAVALTAGAVPTWYDTSWNVVATTTQATYGTVTAPGGGTTSYIRSSSYKETHYYSVGNLANGKIVDMFNPQIRGVEDIQTPYGETRTSFNLGANWNPFPWLKFRPAINYSTFDGIGVNRRLSITPGMLEKWDAQNAWGARPGPAKNPITGAVITGTDGQPVTYRFGQPKVEQIVNAQDREGTSVVASLQALFNKDGWDVKFQGSYSRSESKDIDISNRHFSNVEISTRTSSNLTNQNVDIGWIDILNFSGPYPQNVVAYKMDGTVFDYSKLANWTIGDQSEPTARSYDNDSKISTITQLQLTANRSLDFLPFPMQVGLTANFRENTTEESVRGGAPSYYQYIGTRPGAAGTPINLKNYVDREYQREEGQGAGFAWNMDWVDPYDMYQHYKENEGLWTTGEANQYNRGNAATATQNYNHAMSKTKALKETEFNITPTVAGSFFKSRLWVGVAAGLTQRTTSNYQMVANSNWSWVLRPDGVRYRDQYYPIGVRTDGAAYDIAKTDGGIYGAGTPVPVPGSTFPEVVKPAANYDFTKDTNLMARMQAAGVDMNTYGHMLTPDDNFWINNTLGYYGDWKQTNPTNWSTASTRQATTANSMEAAKRRVSLMRSETSNWQPVQPKIQTKYNITDWATVRVAWGQGRQLPPLEASGKVGGLVGAITISDYSWDEVDQRYESTITIPNPGLKPKITDKYDFGLDIDALPHNWLRLQADTSLTFIKNSWTERTLLGGNGDTEFLNMLNFYDLDTGTYDQSGITIKTYDVTAGDAKGMTYKIGASGNFGWLGSVAQRFTWRTSYNYSKNKKDPMVGVDQAQIVGQITETTREKLAFQLGFQWWRLQSIFVGSWDSKYTEASSRFFYDFANKRQAPELVAGNSDIKEVQAYKLNAARWQLKWQLSYVMRKSQITLDVSGAEGAPEQEKLIDTLGILPAYATSSGDYTYREWGVRVSLNYSITF